MEVVSNYDSNGNPLKIGTFNNGNGKLNLYDENGKIVRIDTYKDGVLVRVVKF